MLINDASITGSLIVNASSSFQNIAVSGNILPGTNNVYNLGSVDKFFKEIFVSTGSINFVDNTGIKTTISSVAGGGIQIGSVQITTSSISFVDITGSVTQTIAQSSSLGSTSNFTPTSSFNSYTQSFSSSVSTSFSSSAASVTSLSSSVSASVTSLSSSLTSVNTTQNTRLTTIESVTGSYETNGRGIVSGSSQITYTNISSIPSGIISSSAQLENANITNLTITNLTTVNQTASVLFTSGSNRFGDFGDDTHSFTGSVKISGSFTLVGASTATSYNGTIDATNGVVSGSSQVDLTTTTNYASGILTRLNAVGVFSGSSQVSLSGFDTSNLSENTNLYYTDARVKTKLNAETVISGSKTISGISLGSNLATLTIGTGLSGTSYNGSTAVTIANSGVTSIVAGTGISINQGTAAVTVTNSITNNNQLTNGAGYITSTGTAAAINQTISAGSEGNLVFATIGTNDFFRIRGGGGSNAGFVEIATADDGTEPIYVRQYTGEFTSLTRTATLLDGSGNTSFPGTITSAGNTIITSANIGSQTVSSATSVTGTSTISGKLTISNGANNALQINTDVADNNTRDAIYLYENSGQASGRQAISWYNGGNSYYKARLWTEVGSGYTATQFGIDVADDARSLSTRMYIRNGSANFSGDVTAYASDIRLKENIRPITNAIDRIKKINGVFYDWKDNVSELGFTPISKSDVGVLAQEVQAVFPEIVKPAPFDQENGVSKSGENYLTVKYEKLTALLIEAVKEQQIKIDNLTIEVENLKKPKGL